MKASISVEGLPRLRRAFERVPVQAKATVKREVRKSTVTVQSGAKRRVPVDTGRLRNSISTDYLNEGMTGVVGTNVKYARRIEFGFVGVIQVKAFSVAARTLSIGEGGKFISRGLAGKQRFKTAEGKMVTRRSSGVRFMAAHTRLASTQTVNQPAKPYLFPAFEQEWPQFIARLRAGLAADLRASRG